MTGAVANLASSSKYAQQMSASAPAPKAVAAPRASFAGPEKATAPSEGSAPASGLKAPAPSVMTPGIAQAIAAQTMLHELDPTMLDELTLLAAHPETMQWLADHTELIEKAAGADTTAARELISHLPDGSHVRTMLSLSGLAALFGKGDQVEEQLKAQLIANGPMLLKVADQLKKPQAKLIIGILQEIPFKLDTAIADFETGKLSTTVVGHLIDGKPTAGDVISLFRYARDQQKTGSLVLDPTKPHMHALIASLGLPSLVKVDNIESVRLGPGDNLTLRVKDGTIADSSLAAFHVGNEWTVDLRMLLDPKKSSVTARLGAWQAFTFAYTGVRTHLTGVKGLDTFVDILLKILLTLVGVLLIVAIVSAATRGVSAKIYDQDDGSRRTEVRVLGIKVVTS